MNDKVTIQIGRGQMRKDLYDMREQLKEIAEKEATYLYRLAWRMIAHGAIP